jgi:hypothetical protein
VRAHVKEFTTFEARAVFRGFFVSPCVLCAFDLNVGIYPSPVFEDLIRIFGYPPTLVPTVFQPKNNSRCHHRRGRRRTFQLRQTKKSTVMLKAMKSLLPLNPHTSQIKNEE